VNNKTGSRTTATFCKAYSLGTLRGFPKWEDLLRQAGAPPESASLDDSSVAYLHADLSVTTNIFSGEGTLVRGHDRHWREFCERELCFSVPAELLNTAGEFPEVTRASSES